MKTMAIANGDFEMAECISGPMRSPIVNSQPSSGGGIRAFLVIRGGEQVGITSYLMTVLAESLASAVRVTRNCYNCGQ